MTSEELEKITVEICEFIHLGTINKYIRYGDYVAVDNNDPSIHDPEMRQCGRRLMIEQIQETIQALQEKKEQHPIALCFFSEQSRKKLNTTNFWWNIWINNGRTQNR